MSNLSKKLIKPEEMAEILGVPKTWIYDRTRQGKAAIPHVRLGAYVRFDPDEVIQFFKNKEN